MCFKDYSSTRLGCRISDSKGPLKCLWTLVLHFAQNIKGKSRFSVALSKVTTQASADSCTIVVLCGSAPIWMKYVVYICTALTAA